VIISFGDKETEALFTEGACRRIDSRVQRVARKKLLVLDAASGLDDLRVPPGNRLEALKGDLAGSHSIRVNNQWRIVFVWRGGQAHDVRVQDYH
jgi:proteic killer suppression protein